MVGPTQQRASHAHRQRAAENLASSQTGGRTGLPRGVGRRGPRGRRRERGTGSKKRKQQQQQQRRRRDRVPARARAQGASQPLPVRRVGKRGAEQAQYLASALSSIPFCLTSRAGQRNTTGSSCGRTLWVQSLRTNLLVDWNSPAPPV